MGLLRFGVLLVSEQANFWFTSQFFHAFNTCTFIIFFLCIHILILYHGMTVVWIYYLEFFFLKLWRMQNSILDFSFPITPSNGLKKIELMLKGGAEMQRLIEAIITFASRVPDTDFCHAAALRLQAELKWDGDRTEQLSQRFSRTRQMAFCGRRSLWSPYVQMGCMEFSLPSRDLIRYSRRKWCHYH